MAFSLSQSYIALNWCVGRDALQIVLAIWIDPQKDGGIITS